MSATWRPGSKVVNSRDLKGASFKTSSCSKAFKLLALSVKAIEVKATKDRKVFFKNKRAED
jgi:hypothetical protein